VESREEEKAEEETAEEGMAAAVMVAVETVADWEDWEGPSRKCSAGQGCLHTTQ
jgi:hypothetical protein